MPLYLVVIIVFLILFVTVKPLRYSILIFFMYILIAIAFAVIWIVSKFIELIIKIAN